MANTQAQTERFNIVDRNRYSALNLLRRQALGDNTVTVNETAPAAGDAEATNAKQNGKR